MTESKRHLVGLAKAAHDYEAFAVPGRLATGATAPRSHWVQRFDPRTTRSHSRMNSYDRLMAHLWRIRRDSLSSAEAPHLD